MTATRLVGVFLLAVVVVAAIAEMSEARIGGNVGDRLRRTMRGRDRRRPKLRPLREERGFKDKQFSFHPPFGFGDDGIDVSDWEFGGDVVATEKFLRLTPDRQSRRGWIANKHDVVMTDWQVVLRVKVHGQGKLGADGLAFWYSKAVDWAEADGRLFGGPLAFSGLGVFIDTFDNDNDGEHPYVMAMLGNGVEEYEHDKDGASTQLGGCQASIRNQKGEARLRILYENKKLTVSLDTSNRRNWEECFSVENVYLPAGYRFAVSAATGDLADNHDVFEFSTYDLSDEADEIPVGGDNTGSGAVMDDDKAGNTQETRAEAEAREAATTAPARNKVIKNRHKGKHVGRSSGLFTIFVWVVMGVLGVVFLGVGGFLLNRHLKERRRGPRL